jgi:hypothetical protein
MTAPAHPGASEKLLRGLLDGAGVGYTLRVDGSGRPYAGLQWVSPTQPTPVGVTCKCWGKALDVRVHGVARVSQPEEIDLRLMNEINQDWNHGRIYVRDRSGEYDAASWLAWGARQPSGEDVRSLILELVAAVPAIAARGVPSPLLAPAPNGEGLDDVERALADVNLEFRRKREGRLLSQMVRSSAGVAYLVELFKIDRRYLFVRANRNPRLTVPVNLATLQVLNDLNGRLSLGGFALDCDGARAYFAAGLPLARITIDGELVGALVDRAVHALTALDQRLPP